MPVDEKGLEAVARALHPDLFSDDERVRHQAASPMSVKVMQDRYLDKARAAIEAYEANRSDAARIRAEALQKHVSIYTVEEDEGTVRVSAFGQEIVAVAANGAKGIALLKLDAAIRSLAAGET